MAGNDPSRATPIAPQVDVDLLVLGRALRRAQHELRLAIDGELSEQGTNSSQVNLLREIRANPGSSSAQLARRAALTPQTLGQQVNQLQRLGLVERRGGSRRLEHFITVAGERLYETATERVSAVQSRVFGDFDGRELASLAGAFSTIARRAAEERARAKLID
jgi:DNA-binding MarR family transcriptional regulator